MSYAIIRNEKYKRVNLKGIYRHNERKNINYSNANIDKERTHLNYYIKQPQNSYEKEFERIKKDFDLKGQIKEVSNIVCECIITSDNNFFKEIGAEETKRYFKTAYDFICQYKDLKEQYILSAVVHMDEETPHMHLVFIPVVHTMNKQHQEIDKIACSEFWKAKNSYRDLQDTFYSYIKNNNFNLERGTPSEKEHLSIEKYKEVTNYKNTKELLNNINLELPETPDIKDIKKIMINRDEKIENEIIKPKDELIQELYKDNLSLHKELSKQANLIEKAEKFEEERVSLTNTNINLKNKCHELEEKITNIEFDLKFDYENEISQLNNKYQKEIKGLKKQIEKFEKAFDNIKTTIKSFITWVCKKLSAQSEEEIIHKFEKECDIDFNIDKQLHNKVLEREEYEIEM